ncbi:cytochrome P450 [Sphingobium xenophagum]|uniref:Cytochrome P450 n=1 Tax=Sphingobium xenophagum TaxID=121428 RepID=A0ABU1WZI9_SPHXE|nr:cytochrome P450 [Sphingobium xenophagum]MDR7154336.1 cytochrome P450 [Sphingobium xenophagum]
MKIQGIESRTDDGGAAIVEIDPFSRDVLADPYAFHPQLRDAGPVVWFPKYGVFGVARYGEVKTVLSDWQTYCSSRGVGLADFAREIPWRTPSLQLERDPPLHAATRGVMNKVVALPRLKSLAPHWKQVAAELVESLAGRRRFDAVQDLAEQFPLRIFPDTLGLLKEGRENLLAYATSTFNAFGPRNDVFLESQVGLDAAQAWIAEACRYENLAPGGWGRDVHDAAAEAGISEGERELLVRSFLSAGIDTTINGIGNLLHAFTLHPTEWQKLRSDRSLIKRAFEEGLRWQGTAQSFFRTTTRETELSGVRLPEGAKIIAFLAAANRDPRHWPDAERFDITRQTSGHVGFGYGIHQCLGQMIARQESEILLEALSSRFASFRAAGVSERRLNNTLFALRSLPVEVDLA